MPTDRHFLVARERHRVIIREVTAESCVFTLGRDAAWNRAKLYAKGAPRSHNPFHRKRANVVEFVSLDMSVRNLNISDFLPREQTEPQAHRQPVAENVQSTRTVSTDILKALTS